MRNEEIYTVITFQDGSEVLIKGLDEADEYMQKHAEEIFLTYTDHSGSEHLERRLTK